MRTDTGKHTFIRGREIWLRVHHPQYATRCFGWMKSMTTFLSVNKVWLADCTNQARGVTLEPPNVAPLGAMTDQSSDTMVSRAENRCHFHVCRLIIRGSRQTMENWPPR